MAITGHYLGTEDGGESKLGTQKKFIVLNKCVNVVLISHMSHGQFLFKKNLK